MAEYNKGILGGFSGKVGTVVGAKWRGKLIMRSLPSKSGKKATEAQIKQRTKFSIMAKFLAPVRKVTSAFFGEYQGAKSRTDLAMSYQLTDTIIEKADGSFEIDFKKVVFSKGYVSTVTGITQTLADAKITVNWMDNSGNSDAKADDRILVILYSKKHNQFVISNNTEAFRKDKKIEVAIPTHWKEKENVAWLLLSNNARNQGSNSTFLGEI